MNRDILFRAKKFMSVEDYDWVCGYYFKKKNKAYILPYDSNMRKRVRIDESTLCEWIGCEDINHRYIYEGDIFKNSEQDKEYVVAYCKGRFMGLDYHGSYLYAVDWKNCTIIANRYDYKQYFNDNFIWKTSLTK